MSCSGRFTGKERDSESGLDYFGARYYGSALGRFTSPDWSAKPEPVPYADLSNPQSLNQYIYVLNNPLAHPDADGHCCDFSGAWQDVQDFAAGVGQGVRASVSFGLVGSPQSSDSIANRAGQALGSVAVGIVGDDVRNAGAGIALVTSETGVGVAVGAAVATAGTALEVGAGKNLVDVATTPVERRAGDFSSSTREGAIKGNAAANGGTNKCENCGRDVVRVGNQKGQAPPGNQLQVHHDPPSSEGGGKDSKPVVLCRDCHQDVHNQ